MATIDILVADDHAVVREGLVALLTGEPDMRVVAQAEDGAQAVALCGEHGPAVVLLDMRMPGLGGAAAIAQLRAACPQSCVLVLSMSDEPSYVQAALAAGATGYVTKRAGSRVLLTAVRAAAAGERFVEPGLSTAPQAPSTLALSAREADVARLIADGHTGRTIAERLGISKSSVDTYRTRIFNKLGVESRAELIQRLRAEARATDDGEAAG